MNKTNKNNIELENINVSAINWFEAKNSYSEKLLKKLFMIIVGGVKKILLNLKMI